MAVAKYGTIVTELKGRIGGNVFQGGYGSNVFKNKGDISKHKRNTAFVGKTSTKRAIFSEVAQAWRGLTDIQRLGWNGAAASFPATNKFGDIYTPSGYQLFMQFNSVAVANGGGVNADTPIPVTFPSLVGSTIVSLTTSVFEINVPFEGSDDFNLEVLASNCFSPGAKSSRGGLKIIGFFSPLVTGNVDLITKWRAVYGTLFLNQRINIQVRVVHQVDGICSLWYNLTGIVSA